MNWSKERDESSNDLIDIEESRRWRRIWVTILTLILLVCCGIGLTAYLSSGDPAAKLAAAAEALTQANQSDDPHTKFQLATSAANAARQARRWKGDKSTSNLILAAALSIRLEDPEFSIDDRTDLAMAKNEIQPSDCETYVLWQAAEAFFSIGDYDLADWVLREALTREDYRKEVLRLAIQVHYDQGAENSALRLCVELSKLDPQDCLPWRAMAYVFEDRQTNEQLAEAYGELLKRNCEESGPIRLKLVNTLIQLGNAQAAEQQWRQLLTLNPDIANENRVTAAKLQLLLGNLSESKSLAAEILEKNPNQIDALVLNAQFALSAGDAPTAIASLETVVRLDPTHPEAHYLLGQAYAKANRREDAERELAFHEQLLTTLVELHKLERLSAIEIKNSELRMQIASIYTKLGLHEIAKYWQDSAEAIAKLAPPPRQ